MGNISRVKNIKTSINPKMYWLYYHKGSCFFNKTKKLPFKQRELAVHPRELGLSGIPNLVEGCVC